MSSLADRAPSESWSIDALADRTGITVRNIRFYTDQGLLPPPRREGRTAVYDQVHRSRLDLVRKLHDQGYTLAAIGRVLSRVPLSATPEEVATRALLFHPWVTPHLSVESASDPTGMVPIDSSEEGPLRALGLLVDRDGQASAPSDLVEHARRVAEAGVPGDLLTRAGSLMEVHVDALVRDLFDAAAADLPRHDWDAFMASMGSAFPHLRALVLEALAGRFAARINEHTQAWVSGGTTTATPPPAQQ